MKRIEWSNATQRRATQEEERAATIPSSLEFVLLGGPALREVRRVELRGVLRNQSTESVDVVLFPVHDRTPFFVRVAVSENIALKPVPGPPIPPEPPPGRFMTLPPMTEILFAESVDFDEYNARIIFGTELEWSFEFWAELKPGGVIVLGDEIASSLSQ